MKKKRNESEGEQKVKGIYKQSRRREERGTTMRTKTGAMRRDVRRGEKGPDVVAQLARALCLYARAVSSIPG